MSGPTGPTGPNTPSGESWDQQPPLALARLALERGDYGQVIRMLTPFSGPGTGQGADASEVLLLLATAWMGLGDNAEALACCRRLRACGDATIRGQATELQRVLEAPSLQRPREWSLTLPDLPGSNAAMGRQLGELSRRRRIKPPPPPPRPWDPPGHHWGLRWWWWLWCCSASCSAAAAKCTPNCASAVPAGCRCAIT